MTYDFLQLNGESSVPLYQQLYSAICRAVESGHLKAGERLPSIRALAEGLNVSCTTVESAYQQLCVEGYIRARPQRGYFVLDARRPEPVRAVPPSPAPRPAAPQAVYNFGSDCVDSENMDLKLWRRQIRDVLNRQELIASYGDHQGEYALREALSSYSYGARGVLASPDQIVIGAGTQPLLSILCGLLNGGETTVAMEEPGFRQAEQIFSDCGFSVLKLPGDEDGPRMDTLAASGAKLLFVSPSNRVRTGTSLPISRRMELLRWAWENGGIIIEDDHNGELRYRARPIPALQGMGAGRSVVYIGSFSKLLLPSVRIGYMALTPDLLERYRRRAGNYNQTASKIEQLALANYMKSGQMERHLRRLRKLYGSKCDLLSHELKSAFGSRVEILLQETPLSMILTVHANADAETLRDLALRQGVRIGTTSGGEKVLLGFAGIPSEQIKNAVQCLKTAWKDVLS
ncbi:MocR-like pyridoxine biosynthesis transcription factor PdxR [Caproicibacter fermentans]|uniref:PLP-dependent aminotransferase family protein n=1 Tax=Caproicibacter fermentans TaxID=2576756 RepID=A0A7G8T9T1_9FIRM|nr:PLP-dependent aminotransferase family protein [Caproicibacter fermentans]QNK40372.1 PLP-dependent aminotransferase family protein [Caproicibacter fermentans]